MKRHILRSCALVCLCLIFISPLQAQERPREDSPSYKKQQLTILKTLKKETDRPSKKADINLDYIEQIMAYYKAGSALSKNVMDYGDNQVIRQVGRNIRKRNGDEMKKMDELRLKLKEEKIEDDVKETGYLVDFKQVLERMVEDIESVEDTNVDRLFLLQMICYNEGIINISKHILQNTPNIQVQEIAQKIIDRHTKEIPYLQKLAKEIRA